MKFFTNQELKELAVSILALGVIFSFLDFSSSNFLSLFFITILISFISLISREIGHKFVAKKLGCLATYKLWSTGILIGILSIIFRLFTGIVFVAPGYVDIMPYSFGRWGFKVVRLTPKDFGLICLAGTGINILFALIFKMFSGSVFQLMSDVNALLAFYTLLPIPPLNGSKIFMWSMTIWLFLIFITFLLIIF